MDKQPITRQKLEGYLWEAACILRGRLDAADFKQYVFPLLFWKRISDVYDEEYQEALMEGAGGESFAAFRDNHRFQIPEGCHWTDLRELSSEIGEKIRNSMQAMERENEILLGIFGDANWTNRERMPDRLLKDLIDHISSESLTSSRVPADEFGLAYEYLIKKFADDSGHTAQEFYTNRTVVNLMTEILKPHESETIYDPTCGTGGMLLNCVVYTKNKGNEYRNIKLYGQELNFMTSAISKMNMIVHNIDEFRIERGDTLSEPGFFENGKLKRFDIVLANPPYSISNWMQDVWANDPFGRNKSGVPPQGCADYAFLQHVIASMNETTGRAAILVPHGVLFRDDEAKIRQKIIESDVIEGVIGLGPNLFYNSTMEACVLVLRSQKRSSDRGTIMFIDAHKEIRRRNAYSFIDDDQLDKISETFNARLEVCGFARCVGIGEIQKNDFKLSIPLYVSTDRYAKYFAQRSDEKEWNGVDISIKEQTDSYRQKIELFKEIIKSAQQGECSEYRLGEIVALSKDTVASPREHDVDRYVGLEHIKPSETRIVEWGYVEDGTSFTKLFEPGDILFSKRRVYLRKAAIADFRGVCSGDILVAKANLEIVIPEYLVHVLHSDGYIRFSVRLSAGGFSPRIRWKDIVDFPVSLPSVEMQDQIAKISAELNSINVSLRNSARTFSDLTESMQKITNSTLVDLSWPFADRVAQG